MLDVSRDEIEAIKSEIRRAGSGASVKLTRLTRQPGVTARLRLIPGTRTLLWVHRLLGWSNLALIVSIPLSFVYLTPGWRVLVLSALILVLLNVIQGEINLELGARVLVISRRMKIE